MKQRLSIKDLEPKAYDHIIELNKYLSTTDLSNTLKELIKIRSSQINGCAFCIDLHTRDALKNGESPRRLFALSAWKESPLFNDKEKALLAITDEVCLISQKGLTEETFLNGKNHFNDNQLAQIIMLIGMINLLNRMAVSTRMFHQE